MRGEGVSVGCLYIDDFTSGKSDPSGPFLLEALPGLCVRRFARLEEPGAWDGLRTALQSLRRECETVGVAARGAGCAAALALSEQLPVDRLALVDPMLSLRGFGLSNAPVSRELRRMAAFARRNLALCVSDALILETGRDRSAGDRILGGVSAQCRAERLRFEVKTGDGMYRIREFEVKQAVSRFLRAGEWPKTLAENREMCIIDG